MVVTAVTIVWCDSNTPQYIADWLNSLQLSWESFTDVINAIIYWKIFMVFSLYGILNSLLPSYPVYVF